MVEGRLEPGQAAPGSMPLITENKGGQRSKTIRRGLRTWEGVCSGGEVGNGELHAFQNKSADKVDNYRNKDAVPKAGG